MPSRYPRTGVGNDSAVRRAAAGTGRRCARVLVVTVDEHGAVGDENVLTADDVAALNGQAVARAAAFTRLAGTAAVIVGAVAAAAWAWGAYRTQARADDFGGIGPIGLDTSVGAPYEVTLADRLDLLVTGTQLLVAGVLGVGVGLVLRLLADYTVARTGGSLTGFEAGDTA
jgi:hypothetical protein